jgi:hypothetical protein
MNNSPLNQYFINMIEECRKDVAKCEVTLTHDINAFPYHSRDVFTDALKRSKKLLAAAEGALNAANDAAVFADTFASQHIVGGCYLVLKGDSRPGLYSKYKWLCSPLFVERRIRSGSFYTHLRIFTPDNNWMDVCVPAAELNDHGAKLRSRLLKAGAVVAVDTVLRRALLEFILNCPSADEMKSAGESFTLPDWLTGSAS